VRVGHHDDLATTESHILARLANELVDAGKQKTRLSGPFTSG